MSRFFPQLSALQELGQALRFGGLCLFFHHYVAELTLVRVHVYGCYYCSGYYRLSTGCSAKDRPCFQRLMMKVTFSWWINGHQDLDITEGKRLLS